MSSQEAMPENTGEQKKHIRIRVPVIGLAVLIWALSFITDTKIFSGDGLNMNCLPVDTSMTLFMHIAMKLCVLAFWYLFLTFLTKLWEKKELLIVFVILLAVYGAGLAITYPGYYMNDDPIIFAYATRFLPVYWHNYLTSLFYMTAMSIFPASCGPVLLSDVCYACFFTLIYEKGLSLIKGKNPLPRVLLILPGLLPFTLLGALMCFRPAIYSSFFMLYFMLLYFDKKTGAGFTSKRLILYALLTAVLSLWRSESIVLLPLSVILIFLAFKPTGKQLLTFFLASLCLYALISIPQKGGENKYYGSDYLILSTTRPLSVIVWRDQTYPGADEDIANISAVTDFGYLHNDSLSCSAYNRYNSDHNEGRYTQTGADKETQSRYLKSAFNLIAHNFDLYLGERLQLFCVTNGFYNYNKAMVLNLKPVISSDFHLYEHDRDYGFEMLDAYRRVPLTRHDGWALFLFAAGGEAFLPVLVLCFALLILSLFKKKWFGFFFFGALLAREAVIFLTAPASFIQYSYPTMYVAATVTLVTLALWADRRSSSRTEEKQGAESSVSEE